MKQLIALIIKAKPKSIQIELRIERRKPLVMHATLFLLLL